MIHPESLQHEDAVVWLEDPAGLPYVRETTAHAGTRQRPVPWQGAGRRVGYATLRPDAPSESGCPGVFERRIFWLAPHDRDSEPSGCYRDGWPLEAVYPATVRAGVQGTRLEDQEP